MIPMTCSEIVGEFRGGVVCDIKLPTSATLEVLMGSSAQPATGGAGHSAFSAGMTIIYKPATPEQRASRIATLMSDGFSEAEAIQGFEIQEAKRLGIEPAGGTSQPDEGKVWRPGHLLGSVEKGFELAARDGRYPLAEGSWTRVLNPLGMASLNADHPNLNGNGCKHTRVPRIGATCWGPVYRFRLTGPRPQNSKRRAVWERGYLAYRPPKVVYMAADGDLSQELVGHEPLGSQDRFIVALASVQEWSAVAEKEAEALRFSERAFL